MKHRIHPEALAELEGVVDEYAGADPKLAAEFFHEMERLIAEVCARPGTFREFDPPARRHFSHRFPYGIIYLIRA